MPLVTYTRGLDLSGSLEGAGGIGGLLARSEGYSGGNWTGHAYYHCDGNGNVTALANNQQVLVAKYLYDPYGNLLGQWGPLADANVYRFSSKEYHAKSGLYYYGSRFYDANLQRWITRDRLWELRSMNLYGFVGNNPINGFDPIGLEHVQEPGFTKPVSEAGNIWETPAGTFIEYAFPAALIGGIGGGLALAGAGGDLGLQLWNNGGRLECVSWPSVGLSGLATGAGYGVVATAGKVDKMLSTGQVLERAAAKRVPLSNYITKPNKGAKP